MKQQVPEETISIRKKKKGAFREYAESLLLAVLIALLIRSFVIEAFKIPSSSMIPTLVIGDHIFVNKFIYGLRIPLTKIRFLDYRKPKRGEVVVFIYPQDEHKDFIKRVVGLPGDRVLLDGTDLYVNGMKISKERVFVSFDKEKEVLKIEDGGDFKSIPFFPNWQSMDFFVENIGGIKHIVQYERGAYRQRAEYEVPEGHLFVVGDNRDNSSDSRDWGFVPLENVKGKALFVWLSVDRQNWRLRWRRIGRLVK